MEIAIWIIAICEIIRAIQNIVPLVLQIKNSKNQQNAYLEFINSLKKTDKEFMVDLIREYEKQEGEMNKEDGNNDQ